MDLSANSDREGEGCANPAECGHCANEQELAEMGRDLFEIDHPLVYLACPYSHKDPAVKEQRFRLANAAAANLMQQGMPVFSTITHNHPIALKHNLPGDWKFWEGYNRAFLSCSHKLIVLMADGWEDSVGVQAEIAIANELGINIEFLEAEAFNAEMILK